VAGVMIKASAGLDHRSGHATLERRDLLPRRSVGARGSGSDASSCGLASNSTTARGEDDLLSLFQSAGFGVTGTRGSPDPLHRRASVSIHQHQWRLDSTEADR
jgi:hypothetical protein